VRSHLATFVAEFRRHGNQRAVVAHRGVRAHSHTYSEIADLAERFAAELMAREIASGERVVLWGENSAEWMAAFWGCVLRGVLVVPLDAASEAGFVGRVVAQTRPRLIVASRTLLTRLAAALPADSAASLAGRFPFLVLEDLASSLPLPPFTAPVVEPSLGPETPLQILFTSGTTAEPKGIVHTHRNVLASLEPVEREIGKYLRYERLVHPLRILHTLPLSHVFGQFMGLWIPPLLAAEVHFELRLEPARLLELIRRHRISVLAGVPRLLEVLRAELMARLPGLASRLEAAQQQRIWRRWWSFRDVHRIFGWKFWALVCGGAAVPPALERFWSSIGLALIQGYGMTETAALISLNHPFRPASGTIGKPLPGREIRIGDDGEISVRGEMVSRTRWQNGRLTTLADPWLSTGDLAGEDSEGNLLFLGRKSETIVTPAGLNVHPEDVEAELNRQPGVEASAVVPLLTEAGAEPVAVLLFRGAPEQAQSAIDAANASLADYQRVRLWKLWPHLDFPRSSLGKILRPRVKQWVAAEWGERQQEASPPAAPAQQDPLAALVASVSRAPSASFADEARLDRDLNLDSLGRVQLQSELEQHFGVSIPDEEFAGIATLGELRAYLQTAHMPIGTSPQPILEAAAPSTAAAPAEKAAPALSGPSRAPRYHYAEWNGWWLVQWLRRLFQEAVMRPLVWLLGAPGIDAAAELPRSSEPLLLIANHVTMYDAALVLYALPIRMRRKVAIAMSAQTLEDLRRGRNQGNWFLNLVAPLGYWAITPLFNVFPLPAGAGLRRSFAHAGRVMDRGYHVLVFPEGQRSADGTLLAFRSGIGVLAREAGARVLPIALLGLGELRQRRRGWFRSGILKIRVGLPIALDPQLSPATIAESLRRALASLMER